MACTNMGRPKNATEKNRSLSTVPRKNGMPAVYDIISPLKPRGYISGHAAQTAKLLIRKNDIELAKAAPTTRKSPDFWRSVVPRSRIAAYQAHVTKWSHVST